MEKKVETRIEHLKMIQTNIARMSSNSFIVKGWSVTSIGAMYAYWLTKNNRYLLFLILGITILFWLHDAYYLMLERGFRNLYDRIRFEELPTDKETFEMSPKIEEKILCVAVSRKILLLPYGLISLFTIVLAFCTK